MALSWQQQSEEMEVGSYEVFLGLNATVDKGKGFNIQKTKDTKCKKGDLILPPCRVCDTKASGFHFGVFTCEACKVFFRRYLRNNTPYLCMKQENCEVKPGRRGCSYCRLQKCFSLGMSKEGIQKGRYTVEKKSQTFKEVKMLREEKSKATLKEEKLKLLADLMLELYLEKVIIPETLTKLPDLRKNYAAFNSARESVFGLSFPLTPQVHEDVYKATGMDVDSRYDTLRACFSCCEHEFAHGMKYIKQVPGFKELCTDDKYRLAKEVGFDMSVISSLEGIDPELMTYSCLICGCTTGEYEFKMMYRDHDVRPMFYVVGKLKNLCMTEEELSVVIPYTLFLQAKQVEYLTDPQNVERQRCMIGEVLRYVIEKSRGEKAGTFLKELNEALAELRIVAQRHCQAAKEFLKAYPDFVFPPVVHELFGDTCTITYQLLAN